MDHSRRPGWLLDELATAGRENLEAEHVRRYDTKMDAGGPEEVAFLQSYGMDEGSTVIDLGAGTGQFTRAVAPHVRRVVAVDVSPVMLAALRANVDAAALGNVEVVQAGFLTYEHQGAPADFVYSRFALHHLPDFWKGFALQRVHDVLGPGGWFRLSDVVYDFEPTEAADRIEAWCKTATSSDDVDVDSGWGRWELEEHVRDEHSTYRWLLEPMLQRVGFVIESADFTDDGIFARYLAGAVSAQGR